MLLQDFLASEKCSSAWVEFEHIEVYIRRDRKVVQGDLLDVFTLANAEVQPEEHRGTGVFWAPSSKAKPSLCRSKQTRNFLRECHE